jgi:hypothetical protein
VERVLHITVHNLYPGLELTSPVYFSTSTRCHISSSQQTSTSTIMEASFGIDSRWEDFKGVLLYKLQRKYITRIDNQLNINTALIEDTAKNIYLLVVWNVDYHKHEFYVFLIECTADFAWDKDKLWVLYWKYYDQIRSDYKSGVITWLIHGDTVMKMRYDVTYGSNYKLNIIISEETEKYNMERPIEIEPKRLVFPLSILIILTYVYIFLVFPSHH